MNDPQTRHSQRVLFVQVSLMDGRSNSRTKTPLRQGTHSRTSSQTSVSRVHDPHTLNFGTASELAAAVTTSPTARTIPPQTPSQSLAGRTMETLRLARERQLASARKTPRPSTSTKATTNNTFLRNNSQSSVSVSKPRVQTTSTFNPWRSPPKTPISSIPASTSAHARRVPQVANPSVASSPKTTPTSVRTTSAGSSMAVRDAIKKAKEAHKQKLNTPPTKPKRINYNDESSFDDIDNPFNTSPGTPPLQAQLKRAIENGRTTGIIIVLQRSHKRQFEHIKSRID